jgi:4-hydroxy-tetrahydrodipicolinate synthase
MTSHVFDGVMPALMTPCRSDGTPDVEALVASGLRLRSAGMGAVVYCGSMGDWPLLTDEQRQAGVAALVGAGLPVIVGTGAISPASAVDHARHAAAVGAAGLMVIPRVLSRGSSSAAQRDHFRAVLDAADGLPAVIYNSPYYGFTTDASLFFDLRSDFPNLVGFKEFAGGDALTYAAEHITSGDDDLSLLVGVDTQVVHGVVNCGATGAITGIGNVLPAAVLELFRLARLAAAGDATAHRAAVDLERALMPLSAFDEGPDLVLYYKHLAVLTGHHEFEHAVHSADTLSPAQAAFAEAQLERFEAWWLHSTAAAPTPD